MTFSRTISKSLNKYGISEDEYASSKNTLLHLGFSEPNANKIIFRNGSKIIVKTIKILFKELIKNFSHQQITHIAARRYGNKSLKAIAEHFHWQQKNGFTTKDIISISTHIGSHNAIACLIKNYNKLTNLTFTNKEIAKFISCQCASPKIETILHIYPELIRLNMTKAEIIYILSPLSGDKSLESIIKYYNALILKGYDLSQIVKLASVYGGGENIKFVNKYHNVLTQKKYSLDQVTDMASKQYGFKNIEAVANHHDALLKKGYTIASIANLANNVRGAENITKALKNPSPFIEKEKLDEQNLHTATITDNPEKYDLACDNDILSGIFIDSFNYDESTVSAILSEFDPEIQIENKPEASSIYEAPLEKSGAAVQVNETISIHLRMLPLE